MRLDFLNFKQRDPLLAGAVAGSIVQPIMQMITNQQERKWNEKMYGMQRNDALTDWKRQNDYNSPVAQMQRLKDAGLNPNLVYGNGATATSSQPVRSTDIKPWHPQTPQFDAMSLLNIIGAKKTSAETDLVKENIKTQQKQQQFIEANTGRILKDTDLKTFDLWQKGQLAQYQQDAAKLGVEKLQVGNALSWQDLEQKEKAFPLKLQQLEGNIKATYTEIAKKRLEMTMVPFQRQLIEANIKKIQNGNYFDNMTMDDRISATRAMSKIADSRVTGQELENQIKAAEATFRKAGISPTIISDLIRSIIGVRINK